MSVFIEFDDVVLDRQRQPPLDPQVFEDTALAVLKRLPVESAQEVELTILLTGDEKLRELNLQYLEIDSPTDVLSFPAEELDPDSNALYLGDIVCSYQRAQVQATAAGYPVEAELQLLVVHGVLHLLGYDHAGDEEKAAMWALQSEILKDLGSPAYPPDD